MIHHQLRVTISARVIQWSFVLALISMFLNGAAADVLFDSLCMTDGYYQGYYNHCGGELYWGQPVDIQIAGQFPLSDNTLVTSITGDFICFYDMEPESICVNFYDGGQRCRPLAEDAFAYMQTSGEEVLVDPFKDTEYGLYGLRFTVVLSHPIYLPASNWYLDIQPVGQDAYGQVSNGSTEGCSASTCDFVTRDGGRRNTCCDGVGLFGQEDWFDSGQFEPVTLAMRVEGVPAGDCQIGGALSARCKAGKGKVVAKIKGASGAGVLTCWLDATPGPRRDMTIGADGKGKTVFRNVAPGEHTVTVCDQTVDAACGP